MKHLNESEVVAKWSPMIESTTGLKDAQKLGWISKYAHYHALNEASMGGVSSPYATLYNVPGVGNAMPSTMAGMTGAQQTNPASLGSGDKWPSLLPMSLQVAGRTVGFDVVNVVPMPGPTGQIAYMDYVYAGGKGPYGAPGQYDENGMPKHNPKMGASLMESPMLFSIKVDPVTGVGARSFGTLVAGDVVYFIGDTVKLHTKYVGKGRIDGYPIFRLIEFVDATSGAKIDSTLSVVFSKLGVEASTDLEGTDVIATSLNYPSMVSTLEDQVQGFVGSGADDKDPWSGTWVNGTELYEPMERGTGEMTYARPLGLQVYTKMVQVGTYQVAVNVTQEQIQDLNSQWGIDVISMVENAGINEISQSINKHITSRLFAMGWKNHIGAERAEDINLNLDVTSTSSGAKTLAYAYSEDGKTIKAAMDYEPITFGPTTTASLSNQDVVIKAIMAQVLAAGNVITQRGRRGPANFIITNSKLATAFQSNSQYAFSPIENTFTQSNGSLYPVGTIAGMTVYVDPNMSYHDTRVLVGRKGAADEPGVIFCPYLMAESVKLITEGTASPKVIIKSRYALVDAGYHPETMYLTFAVKTSGGAII
ncbi:MAG: hypothetical protein ACRDD8_15135 [Bacteroidales bacterium]